MAVPGTLTSAYLALRLHSGEFTHKVVPFDEIPQRVLDGTVHAGLLIHEGQITYAGAGLRKLCDLGEWWKKETGLPLPLGVNLVRKDLGVERCRQAARLLRRAIEYSLSHREEALAYAMQFGRGLDRDLTDRFVGMYVNDLTRDAGSRDGGRSPSSWTGATFAGFSPGRSSPTSSHRRPPWIRPSARGPHPPSAAPPTFSASITEEKFIPRETFPLRNISPGGLARSGSGLAATSGQGPRERRSGRSLSGEADPSGISGGGRPEMPCN